MKKKYRILIIALVCIVAVGIILMKMLSGTADGTDTSKISQNQDKGIPTLVDLGSKNCIPCKKMEPILEELRTEYKGELNVIFYDVNEFPEKAQEYQIRVIPTQIFLDAEGKELFRHEGFLTKNKILDIWKKEGYTL
jgi:thioredoxin 1